MAAIIIYNKTKKNYLQQRENIKDEINTHNFFFFLNKLRYIDTKLNIIHLNKQVNKHSLVTLIISVRLTSRDTNISLR
jgi:hypothetical protein